MSLPLPAPASGRHNSALPAIRPAELLRRHGLRPRKSLGQNFLCDEHILAHIVEAAGVDPAAHVLEIGPGLGSLTRHLARAGGQVTAVELDAALLPALREVLAPFDNVSIVQGDILHLNLASLIGPGRWQVVANIPYYITSAVIRRLLEAVPPPFALALTVQQEVARRICASPGDLSLLALGVQVYGRPQQVLSIPAGAFYPPPKVDSALLRVELYGEPLLPRHRLDAFFRLAKAGFSQRRKTLRNAFSAGLHLSPAEAGARLQQAGIDPMRRAETLSLDEWDRLVDIFEG